MQSRQIRLLHRQPRISVYCHTSWTEYTVMRREQRHKCILPAATTFHALSHTESLPTPASPRRKEIKPALSDSTRYKVTKNGRKPKKRDRERGSRTPRKAEAGALDPPITGAEVYMCKKEGRRKHGACTKEWKGAHAARKAAGAQKRKGRGKQHATGSTTNNAKHRHTRTRAGSLPTIRPRSGRIRVLRT